MASFDGHGPKRPRTDRENRAYGPLSAYYNQNRSGRGDYVEKPNHILLMTVINPAYPITVDVIHAICKTSGKVLRIVIFKKNGVQALVEFDSTESAKRAKSSLNGADIYSGCCTLKIDYAKPTKLNVFKNDNESFDYTNPHLGKGPERPALLGEPRGFVGGPGIYRDGRGPPPGQGGYGSDADGYDGYGVDPYGPPPRGPQDRYGGPPPPEMYGRYGHDMYDGREGPFTPQGYGMMPGGPPGGLPQQGSVLMVYGLNKDKINCDKLFNLFCLYGNVMRIKFLKSKEGCVMIQMGDPLSVERAVANLKNVAFFGAKMQLGFSKQAFLNDVQQPFELPDGTSSFKDYMGNRNNRFTNPEAASKNRIQPPSRILHFFNCPPGIKDSEIKKCFEDKGITPPKNTKMFQTKSERSSSGIVEFENLTEALEAIVTTNHVPLPNPNGKFPYILKLCFSSSGSRF